MLTLPWLESSRRRTPWDTRVTSRLVTPATDIPVSAELLIEQANILDTAVSMEVLDLRIRAATAWCETYTGLACLPQVWEAIIHGEVLDTEPLLLPMAPVLAVTSVTSYDTVNASTVMNAAFYTSDIYSRPGRVILNSGQAWPSGLRLESSLVVRYSAGHATVDDVPALLKLAILQLAAEFHERREAATDLKLMDVPFGVRNLLDPLRTMVNG